MKIAIIGGGMSGLITGIEASKNKNNSITIFERQESIGKKILMTGNGRCNLSNINVCDVKHYSSRNINRLNALINKQDYKIIEEYFRNLGLYTRIKNDGLYPYSNQALSVLEMLKIALNKPNINIKTKCYIDNIIRQDDKWIVDDDLFDAVVICTGGKAGVYKESEENGFCIAKKLGIDVTGIGPALAGIEVEDNVKALAGIRAEAKVKVIYDGNTYEDQGELQLTDYGISGIPVFNITSHLNGINKATIFIDFIHDFNKENLTQDINNRLKSNNIINSVSGIVNKKIITYILKEKNIDASNVTNTIDIAGKIVDELSNFQLTPVRIKGFKNAQVSKGGICLDEIDECYMSNKYNNLYFAGEILDVTGECGGYNLHFAFHSGYTIGKNLCK